MILNERFPTINCDDLASLEAQFGVMPQATFYVINPGECRYPFPNKLKNRPVVFAVNDRTQGALGPGSFHKKTLRRAFGTSACVMILVRWSEEKHAHDAITAAFRMGNCFVVETDTARETEWLRFAVKHGPGKAIKLVTPNIAAYHHTEGSA